MDHNGFCKHLVWYNGPWTQNVVSKKCYFHILSYSITNVAEKGKILKIKITLKRKNKYEDKKYDRKKSYENCNQCVMDLPQK